MYNYETTPPEGVWNAIATELEKQEAKVIPIIKKRNYRFYYVAAASAALIIFCLVFFTNRYSKTPGQLVTSDKTEIDTGTNNNVMMTVPVEEKIKERRNGELSTQKTQKVGPKDSRYKYVKPEDSTGDLLANNTPRYITIEGPQGQPVKISSKMATLIDSSETKISSKPIWHKKIDEWREIMKVNTLAPTPGNFLDIVELTKTLKDNK